MSAVNLAALVRLTDTPSSAGIFDMNGPANQNGTITTGRNHNFSVGTDIRPGVGPRNSRQNTSFNVLKRDVLRPRQE